MSNKIQFQRFNMINKASQPGYVYLGNAFDFSGNKGDSNSCSKTYLFSSLIGSKNVNLIPITSKSVEIKVGCGGGTDICSPYEYFVEGVDVIDSDLNFVAGASLDADYYDTVVKSDTTSYHRFTSLQSRWYYFRDINNKTKDEDNPESFSPNNFISNIEKRRDGDYIIEWRSLTTDGSVLIKPSLDSKLFWNGSEYISDEDAFHTEKTDSEDYIFMKTLQYMDVVRSKTTENAVGLVYKKYVDSCLSQNTILLKRIRGSYCLNVTENKHDISISIKEGCNKPTDSLMNKEEFKQRVNMFSSWAEDETEELELIESYRLSLLSLYDEEILDLSNMSWMQQFEYNFFNQLFNPNFTNEEIISDSKQINISFNKKCQRQNIFYGINKDGVREHHILPSFFAYQNLYSINHPDLTEDFSPYPRYTTRTTDVITGGRVTDGKKRVVVPPGAVFRTFKSISGFHSPYENDVLETIPDELHFAVDLYGNILGERSLPSPGLAKFMDSISPDKETDYDIVPKSQVDLLLKNMFETYYGEANRNFFNPEQVEQMRIIKNQNKMYYIAFENCSVHTYINIHHLPIWVELDIFCKYVGSYSDFMCLYQKGFDPIAFDSMNSSCYNESDWNRSVLHSRTVKDETYWNEIIGRYEVGGKAIFEDDESHWDYNGSYLGNKE